MIEAMLSKKSIAHALLLTAQLCFSGWHIIGSLCLKQGANPFVFVLYREVLASLLMLSYVKYCGLRLHIEKEDYYRFLLLGFFSFVNVVGAMLALKYISPTRFSIFQPSIPCIATMISIVLKMETLTVLKATGIVMSVGGAVIAEVWKQKDSSGNRTAENNVVLGTVIVTCQVVGMTCLIVFSKPVLDKYPPPVVTLAYYAVGTGYTILLSAVFAYSLTPGDLIFHTTLLPWLGLGYASVFATLYPYNAYSWAGKQLVPGLTTIYCTFQPIGTIALSFLIFASVITLPEGLGAGLVIAGLLVTVYSQHRDGSGGGRSDSDSSDDCPSDGSLSAIDGSGTHLISERLLRHAVR